LENRPFAGTGPGWTAPIGSWADEGNLTSNALAVDVPLPGSWRIVANLDGILCYSILSGWRV